MWPCSFVHLSDRNRATRSIFLQRVIIPSQTWGQTNDCWLKHDPIDVWAISQIQTESMLQQRGETQHQWDRHLQRLLCEAAGPRGRSWWRDISCYVSVKITFPLFRMKNKKLFCFSSRWECRSYRHNYHVAGWIVDHGFLKRMSVFLPSSNKRLCTHGHYYYICLYCCPWQLYWELCNKSEEMNGWGWGGAQIKGPLVNERHKDDYSPGDHESPRCLLTACWSALGWQVLSDGVYLHLGDTFRHSEDIFGQLTW